MLAHKFSVLMSLCITLTVGVICENEIFVCMNVSMIFDFFLNHVEDVIKKL